MKIRIALQLDIRREQAKSADRESDVDSLVERADPPQRIGFTAPSLEPLPHHDHTRTP